jgi:hypothetical protein
MEGRPRLWDQGRPTREKPNLGEGSLTRSLNSRSCSAGVELLNMAESIKLTLGDGSEIIGQTLEEAEEKVAPLKNRERDAIQRLLQAADSARARKLPKFDSAGNRIS